MQPDLDLARRFLDAHPPTGTVVQCGITGSHLYGFPSPDSDLDLKGIHLAPTAQVLGLDRPSDAHDRLEVFDGVECDLTTHEAGKALSLLLGGNGNIIERLFSPWQLVDSPHVATLRDLAAGALSRRVARHYGGFFKGMQREHARHETPRAKTLLYAYRVALTGVHLLRTAEVEADLRVLAPRYGFDDVEELIALKSSTAESTSIPPGVDALHRSRWPILDGLLVEAEAESLLPAEARNRDACDAWLVQTRRSLAD